MQRLRTFFLLLSRFTFLNSLKGFISTFYICASSNMPSYNVFFKKTVRILLPSVLLFVFRQQDYSRHCKLLWSPYGIGQTIIFLPCGFFFISSFFFSSPNLWMSAILPHMVWP